MFCPNVLMIYLNALTISSNTLTDCPYDLIVRPSNVIDFYLKASGIVKSQVMNSTEVLSTFWQIDHNSQQVVHVSQGMMFSPSI